MKLEISWENDGERSPQIFVPKQTEILLSQALNPFVFKQTFEWPLFVHREMERGRSSVLAHAQIHTAGIGTNVV